MISPLASVVIPTRNRPSALESCLDALAAQTLARGSFEVIVVDDGSTHPIQLDPKKWAPNFELKYIRQQNTGPAGARNRGAAEARGEYLVFTDDDCLPTPTWLENLIATLRRYPEGLVGGTTLNGLRGNTFSETSQLVVEMVYEHFNRNPSDSYFFASNNIALRREHYLAVGGFDSDFGPTASEDRDFCDRWRMTGKPLVWQKIAVVEHRHSQSLTSFCSICFRYGQGAYFYALKRRLRGSGTMADDFGFHLRLPVRSLRKLTRYRLLARTRISANLVLWQAMNAIGFCTAWWRTGFRSPSDANIRHLA